MSSALKRPAAPPNEDNLYRPFKRSRSAGPVVWWARNDLRLGDNPILRTAVGEAFTDARHFVAVFIFDPRFLDYSAYGRVTDPGHVKSIQNRKPVDFSSRKCGALRARFWLQCVRGLGKELAVSGSTLKVCYGRPEDVLVALPRGSLVVCQQEPVSVEQTDVEECVEAKLDQVGSHLRCDWGAMSLYHRNDLPFRIADQMPASYSGLGAALGWKDIWTSTETWDQGVTPVRSPVLPPATFPSGPDALTLPGEMSAETLAADALALAHLGYSPEEVQQALNQELPSGGESAANNHFEQWLNTLADASNRQAMAADWDLPVSGTASSDGHDSLQWANLSKPDGWTKLSHYLALGCISAREVFTGAKGRANFTGVAHRLLWREWHRLNAIQWGRRLFWLQGPGRIERPWSWDQDKIEAWKLGKTGVPYIDACMRELQQTGWLAYKGRKTAAHFLVCDLGIDWRVGAYHYEETLLDYDCAMNYGNWVTVARVDKPRAWGEQEYVDDNHEDLQWKLGAEQANDPQGKYIRNWVPELRMVEDLHIHTPWGMSTEEMQKCSCVIGQDYPQPVTGSLRLTVGGSDDHPGAAAIQDEISFARQEDTLQKGEPEVAEVPQHDEPQLTSDPQI